MKTAPKGVKTEQSFCTVTGARKHTLTAYEYC